MSRVLRRSRGPVRTHRQSVYREYENDARERDRAAHLDRRPPNKKPKHIIPLHRRTPRRPNRLALPQAPRKLIHSALERIPRRARTERELDELGDGRGERGEGRGAREDVQHGVVEGLPEAEDGCAELGVGGRVGY